MDCTAVAVLILSDRYFGRRKGGGEYILERELPYLIERYLAGELDLLPIYWRPSVHFRPDRHDPVKPFEYGWAGARRQFDMHSIQALTRHACLEDTPKAERRDALLDLAAEAERRLDARVGASRRSEAPAEVQGRQPLTVELAVDDAGLRRVVKIDGEVVPLPSPTIPRAELETLRAEADRSLPGTDEQARIGRQLYRLLLGGPDGADQFPRLAELALGLPPGAAVHTRALAIDLRCAPLPCDDPWPLRLPWHLARSDGEPLAECCGWSFESTPPGLRPRGARTLSPEPPLLLLVDDGLPGAARHCTELTQLVDRHQGFGAEAIRLGDPGQLAAAVRRQPEPEILYVYARADLDLAVVAEALGDAVPLLVLNLIGEPVPTPPAALIRDRKVVCALHAAQESSAAQTAGAKWLQGFLGDTAGIGHQRIALRAFGTRLRLWSGCAGLEAPISGVHGRLFRRPLIKLLLDRIAARREVSDEVAAALAQGRGVLGLVAAGAGADHPRGPPHAGAGQAAGAHRPFPRATEAVSLGGQPRALRPGLP